MYIEMDIIGEHFKLFYNFCVSTSALWGHGKNEDTAGWLSN